MNIRIIGAGIGLLVFLFLCSAVREASGKVLAGAEEVKYSFLSGAEEITQETKILTEAQKQAIEKNARVMFDPVLDKEFTFFIGRTNGQITGYAVQHMVKGKWGGIRYMVSLDPGGRIREVKVLEYSEKRGKPIAKRRFLKQFKGKTITDRIKLKKDIHGVTGASISSRGMTAGIRKIVHVFNEFYPTHIPVLP